ncbi:MAG: bifunctional 4-hydroxy-2-oxoglutarate aldolase/2-dehydro-3-deoxy-phosphogluconate aldolase [Planctomycetales bacterium]|nr:bifunctional 4-hydroxy-2-oxoglutarate aldolase/2-dehydro-3-deoxy-phosphogluconate aldolase [Planctomycetales bacterium]
MTTKQRQLDLVLETGLVAVIRASRGDRLVEVAEALSAGGVKALEVTFTVPGAIDVIAQVARAMKGTALVGAGTVLDPETARAALLAGAEFIVSPCLNVDVIRMCRRYDKLVMPGALTPTEVLAAWEAGADVVKVFPSDSVGPAHLKALHGPLPHVRLMPTGGVTLENVGAFIRAGACALGVGGSLVKESLVESGDMEGLSALARKFVDAVKQARNQENVQH